MRNASGNANTRTSAHPPISSMQPSRTGIWVKTSTIRMSCDRLRAMSSREPAKTIQPATGFGQNGIELSLSRCCQASQPAANMIRGPWPSCSVCQGPFASFT